MPEHHAVRQHARTKIVATVGPACRSPEMLAALVEAGVDVFRLNMAHGDPADFESVIADVRQMSEAARRPIAILVDLAGPKIRLGELPEEGVYCRLDDEFEFVRDEADIGPHALTSNYERLVDELSAGDTVMLADGTVSMRVEEVLPDRARCRVVQQGRIRSRQGINLPGVRLSVPTLREDDRDHARWTAGADVDFVSLSFVRSADDVGELKALLAKHGSSAPVVAKIEKREALDNLDAIVQASDAVMVARGDLGVETDVARMPLEQKRIIAACRRYRRPSIIATQMLDSMHHSPRPTRAETTDVANAILDGCDACMLSGETAIGEYPREAVAMMHRIAWATEASLADGTSVITPLSSDSCADVAASQDESRPPRRQSASPAHPVTQAVVYGAGMIAERLRAKLIVVASHSGATALALSSLRSNVPTIGVSDSEETLRKMCLTWGVLPIRDFTGRDAAALAESAARWGQEHGLLSPGDRIVLVAGSHPTAKVHDAVLVHEVRAKGE